MQEDLGRLRRGRVKAVSGDGGRGAGSGGRGAAIASLGDGGAESPERRLRLRRTREMQPSTDAAVSRLEAESLRRPLEAPDVAVSLEAGEEDVEEPEAQGGDITDASGRMDPKHTLAFLRLSVPLPTARPVWTGVEAGGHFYRKQSPRVGWEAGKTLTQSEPQEVHPAGSQASAGQGGAGPRWGTQQAGAGR